MAIGQGSLAGFARVAYEAVGLADFQADNQRAEASYRDSTRGMSDEAIRLELAQDKLRRSLAKGPAAYREQARAELQMRNAERALRGETDALTRSQQRNQSGLGGLRRSIVGLAAGYIGAQGIITLARASANAAREEELVLGQTKVAVEQLGLAYDSNAPKIEKQIGLVRQLGFDDEELAKSFQTLVRSTGDVNEALDQLNLVADVSRGRYVDLEAATQIVNKANLGMSGGLRRIGIDVDKNASRTELLAVLTRSYGQAAEEAMDTGVASADRFSVAVEEIQEAIGRGLAPALADASEEITEWISKEENLEEVQRQVTDAVELGEAAVRGIADALRIAKDVAGPLVTALGGVENTVKLVAGAWLVLKARAIVGFAGTAAASRAASASMVRDAAVAGRAWDVATRPRVMPVGIVAGGGVGSLGRGGLARGALGMLGLTPATAIIAAAGAAAYFGLKSGQKKITAEQFQRMREAAGRGELSREQLAELSGYLNDAQERELRRLIAVAQARGGGAAASPDSRGDRTSPGSVAAETRRREERGRSRGGFTFSDVTRGLAASDERRLDAEGTSGTADDVREERRRLALVNRALRDLELTRDQRIRLKQERLAILSELAQIEQAEDQQAAAINEERARKRAEARRRAEERERKETAAEVRRAGAAAQRYGRWGAGRTTAQVQRELAKAEGAKKAKDDERGMTAAEVRATIFDAFASARGTMNQFGGNFFASGSLQVAGGSPNPELFSMVTELREQTGLLASLTSSTRHPGTRFVRNELASAFDGPTF